MPNRILREGINDSKAVNSLSDSGEIFYRRLMSLVDDYGRYEADPELLRAKLFGRQLDRWTVDRVSQALAEVSGVLTDDGHPLVIVYCYGKYLQINKFDQRVRAQKSKCPSPDGHMLSNDSQMTALARASTTSSTTSTPSSGNVREFPKSTPVPAEADSAASASVSMWEEAGFQSHVDAGDWWKALVVKHPNRNGCVLAESSWLERVRAGKFSRALFDAWYPQQIPKWKKYPQYPNLQRIMQDGEYMLPVITAPAVNYNDPKRYELGD